jgi:uncharacterized membrane protein
VHPALAMLSAARLASLATGRGGVPTPDEWVWLVPLLALVALLGTRLLLSVGLTRVESVALAVGAPALVVLDVPLGSVSPGMTLAANLAGCLLPVGVGLKVLLDRRAPALETFVVLGLGVVVAFFASHVVPERGVLLSYRLPALVLGVAAAALFHDRPRAELAGAVAFASGGIGVLVGADLLHLRELTLSGGAGRIVLGGAGLLDGILLVALLSAAIATCVTALLRYALVGARAGKRAAS